MVITVLTPSDVNLLPNVKSWLQNTIEELLSDSLVDPGRYLIDMSQEEMKMMLIFGVRKLKRTVLHLQVMIICLVILKEVS